MSIPVHTCAYLCIPACYVFELFILACVYLYTCICAFWKTHCYPIIGERDIGHVLKSDKYRTKWSLWCGICFESMSSMAYWEQTNFAQCLILLEMGMEGGQALYPGKPTLIYPQNPKIVLTEILTVCIRLTMNPACTKSRSLKTVHFKFSEELHGMFIAMCV